MPAASKPAALKPAVAEPKEKSRPKPTSQNTKVNEDDAEDSFEAICEPNNNIEENYEPPDEDNNQPAEGSGGNKRRRPARGQPVKLDSIHKPSCDRCVRGKRECHKEAWGGSCYTCVKLRYKCNYAKNGRKVVSNREERDVKEIKGKVKVKLRTLRSSRVFVGDDIEDSFEVNRDPDNNIVEDDEQPDDDDEQPDENNDQPAEGSGGNNRRRRQPVELAAIHEVSEERDVKEMKGKEKEVGTPRSSRVFVGDEIDLPRINDWESKVSFIVPEDEKKMDIKQPARRMKSASHERKYFIH